MFKAIIGNLSTAVAGKVSGKVCYYLENAGITISSLTSTNQLILALPELSELWCQVSAGEASTLYANHVLPVSKAGVLHVVRPSGGGRCLVELFSDDSKHFHYETPNVSSSIADWYVDTSTKV